MIPDTTRPAPTCGDLLQGPTRLVGLPTVGCVQVHVVSKNSALILPRKYLGGTWAALPRGARSGMSSVASSLWARARKGRSTEELHAASACPCQLARCTPPVGLWRSQVLLRGRRERLDGVSSECFSLLKQRLCPLAAWALGFRPRTRLALFTHCVAK